MTSCTITHFTKHSDSSCSHDLAEADVADMQGFDVSDLNEMILSGDCFHIDPMYSADVKLRVECSTTSTIKLRYFNLFGDDIACSMEESEAKTLSTQGSSWSTITAQDGACTPMSNGVYYKFGIKPITKQAESVRRQMSVNSHAPPVPHPTVS